jgi:hypothetical protein
LIEIYHLPSKNNPNFPLIQELFRHVFTPGKDIFIWGTYDELIPFTTSELFTIDQIYGINYCNLQDDFKNYWKKHHPHRTPNPENDTATDDQCICENCLGHTYSHNWALQEAVARELKEYLPKILTNGQFNIGLDPALHSHGQDEDEYAEALTQYALYDVLAMQQLITRMKNNHFTFKFRPTYRIAEDIIDLLPDDLTDENEEQILIEQQPLIVEPEQILMTQTLALTEEQRRKIHNRSCTIKQRHRSFRYELTFYNAYYRFSYRKIKSILRSKHIPFSAVNISKSYTLYVGIKHEFKDKLEEYTRITRNYFTRQHYYQVQYDRRQRTNTSNQHHQHYQNNHRRRRRRTSTDLL